MIAEQKVISGGDFPQVWQPKADDLASLKRVAQDNYFRR
jgi:hypothetical protein